MSDDDRDLCSRTALGQLALRTGLGQGANGIVGRRPYLPQEILFSVAVEQQFGVRHLFPLHIARDAGHEAPTFGPANY